MATVSFPVQYAINLKSSMFQFLLPLVFLSLFEINGKDPVQLLFELNSIISAYDTSHDGDNGLPPVCKHCRNMCSYLHTAIKNKITTLKCAPDPDNIELQGYKLKRQSHYLIPVTTISDPNAVLVRNTEAVQQLDNSVQNQTDLI